MIKKILNQFIVPQFWKRFTIMFLGVFFMGFFLSFLLEVNWGTDPYTFQNNIISQRIGWQFGTWQLLLNGIILLFMVIYSRELIGLGTIANMVLIGYISDFFRWLWARVFPSLSIICSSPQLLWLKIIIFIASILLFAVSTSFYINAKMGLSPYDGLAHIIGQKLKKVSPAVSRMIFDFFVLGMGILSSLGSGINIKSALIGSVLMSLTMGPAIQLVGKFVKKTLLPQI